MKNRAVKYPLWGSLVVAMFAFSALAWGEPVDPPPRPPVEVSEAGPVVVGRVEAIYSYQVERDGILWSRIAAEIAVNHVERGDQFEVGDLGYVRYWVGRRGSDSQARFGQSTAPRLGDTVRVVLSERPDGGFDVASRDGFEVLGVRELARPVLPEVPELDPVPPEPGPAALPSGPANVIRGTVVLYDERLDGMTVDLLAAGGIVSTTSSDDRGRFVFDNVPAGTYSVAAQGIVKNKIRRSPVMPITVLPSATKPTDVVVGLEP